MIWIVGTLSRACSRCSKVTDALLLLLPVFYTNNFLVGTWPTSNAATLQEPTDADRQMPILPDDGAISGGLADDKMQ